MLIIALPPHPAALVYLSGVSTLDTKPLATVAINSYPASEHTDAMRNNGLSQAETPKAISAAEFALRERSVKHEFMELHPYPYAAQVQKLFRVKTPINQDDWFDVEMSGTLMGQLGILETPTKQPLKSGFWARHSDILLGQLPYGQALSQVTGRIPASSGFDEDSLNKVAIQNLQNFRTIIAKYSSDADAAEFETAAPLRQVQIFSKAFEGFSKDLDFPCPWSVWLLNLDDNYKNDGSGDQPHALLAQLASLNGGDFSPFEGINKLSRQDRTDKLRDVFIVAVGHGRTAADIGTPESAASLAHSLWSTLDRQPSEWTLRNSERKALSDKEMVLRFFGKDKLKQFNALPADSSNRKDMRVAASILCLMFQAASGFLIQ